MTIPPEAIPISPNSRHEATGKYPKGSVRRDSVPTVLLNKITDREIFSLSERMAPLRIAIITRRLARPAVFAASELGSPTSSNAWTEKLKKIKYPAL